VSVAYITDFRHRTAAERLSQRADVRDMTPADVLAALGYAPEQRAIFAAPVNPPLRAANGPRVPAPQGARATPTSTDDER
jgi:hypothetical protein